MVALLFAAWRDDRQVFVFGNGGSAAIAGHMVTDLVKSAAVSGHHRLRATSLAENISMTTAIGNDLDYEHIFAFPLETYARPGDIAIAISASGESPNVVVACRWAKEHEMTLVALTGFDGGTISGLADVHVNVPSRNYGMIEDLHLAVGHMVSQALKGRLQSEAITP